MAQSNGLSNVEVIRDAYERVISDEFNWYVAPFLSQSDSRLNPSKASPSLSR